MKAGFLDAPGKASDAPPASASQANGEGLAVYIPLREVRPDHGKPTARFSVGDSCKVLNGVIVRSGEDLDSPQVGRLAHESQVEVTRIGSGPSGTRVCVCGKGGQQGWVSVVAQNGDEKLQVVRTRAPKPALRDKAAVDVVSSKAESEAERAPRTDHGKPTETFNVGDEYEVIHGSQMREAEALDSPQVRVLPNKCRLQVVEIGTGPTGRRIRARDERGREGWVSVAAANGEALLRFVPKRPPEKSDKLALSKASADTSAKCTEVMVRWEDRGHAVEMLREKLVMEGVMQLDLQRVSVVDVQGKTLKPQDGEGIWASREMFPLSMRFALSEPTALQTVMEALRPQDAQASQTAMARAQGPGDLEALEHRLREALSSGDVLEIQRVVLDHAQSLSAQKSKVSKPQPRIATSKPAVPEGWKCPLGFEPFEFLGNFYWKRLFDGLLFEPHKPVPIGIWNSQKHKVEPAIGRTADSPHQQITYFGKTYVLLKGSKLLDPDTQHVVAVLNKESLEIEQIEPIPITVASFLDQQGFCLSSASSSSSPSEATPFIQVLRRSPLPVEDRSEAMAAVSEGSWKALRFASSQLRSDRELVMEAVRGERGAQSWKMLKYAAEQLQRDPELVMEAVKKDVEALRFADPALLENRDFVLDAVQVQGMAIRYASEELKADREIALAAVAQTWQALRHVDDSLREDRELVEKALEQSWRALEHAGSELRADVELLTSAVQQSWCSLQYAAEDLRADSGLVKLAAEQNHEALRYASPELRADRSFMLEAVRAHGLALGHASSQLWSDRDVVTAAVQQNAHALKLASHELRGDRALVLEAVKRDWEAIRYASRHLRADRQLLIACAEQNAESLEQMPEQLYSDRDFMLEAVRLRPMLLGHAPAELLADQELVLEAMKQDWRALRHAAEELLSDRSFMLRAVRLDGTALAFASSELRADAEVVLEAAQRDCEVLEYAEASLCAERSFMLEAVQLHGLALKFAPLKLRADRALVLGAVRQNGMALEHAEDELRGDRTLVLEAARQNPEALGCAGEGLLADRDLALEAVGLDGFSLRFLAESLRSDAGVVLAAVRRNWRALKHAARRLRADRRFMLEAVRVNGLALTFALDDLQRDPELILESTKDPASPLDPSAFTLPVGTLAKLRPPPRIQSSAPQTRISGLPLAAFGALAPKPEDLGAAELLAVAARQLGAGTAETQTPGVLYSALDVVQARLDSARPANAGAHLAVGDLNVQSSGRFAEESAPSASDVPAADSGPGETGGSDVAASSAASVCSTACSKADGPPAAAARKMPNTRVVFS